MKNLEREFISTIEFESALRYIVIPVIWDSSGTACRKSSSCFLETSTEHFVRFLISFGRVLKRNTEFTEKEPSLSLRIFGWELSMFTFIWHNLPSLSLFLRLISPLEFYNFPEICYSIPLSSAFKWVHAEFLQCIPVVVSDTGFNCP